MLALVPVLVMIVGLLLYFGAANPKVARVGEILFGIGAFFTVWRFAGTTSRLL